ncbi:cardiomyopathy-associated protein 5-like [Heptranchias perlo]|uniref:cardiomyopathy-associated protein 5-like n=1 Tax=Heptranchias perlo TaxID=212740 RepID=UPI00355A0645
MTLVRNPHTHAQQAYNESHAATRNIYEHTIGVLKQSLRCLDRTGGALQYSAEQVSRFVLVCCKLPNLTIMREQPLPPSIRRKPEQEEEAEEGDEEEEEEEVQQEVEEEKGRLQCRPAFSARALRDQIINERYHLKDAIKDQSVKPKVNYIMSSSVFSMLTVQSEDSGIVWETVSSSRCSTPWASESTASDVYSVESTPVSSPPGKVIFIMDELPLSPSANECQSGKISKSEKRHIEVTDLRPGELKDALKKPKNNSGKIEPTVIFDTTMDKVAKSKQLMDSIKTETYLQSPMEHSPTVSKIAGKCNEVFASVQENVQQHAPAHCQRKLGKNAVKQSEQSIILKKQGLNSSFSQIPEHQMNISSAQLRKEEESETALKHFLEARISPALPENTEDSKLSSTISSEPVIVSQLRETCKDTDNCLSAIKGLTTNGTIHTGTDDLKKTIITGSDISQSSSDETFVLDFKSLASDMEITPVAYKDNSYLNGSPVDKIFANAVPSHFPEKQEVIIKEDQSYSTADPEDKYPRPSVAISSELANPVVSLQPGETCKDTDNFVSAIEDVTASERIPSCTEGLETTINANSQIRESSSQGIVNLDLNSPEPDIEIMANEYKDISYLEKSQIATEPTTYEGIETEDVDLKNSSFSPAGRTFADMASPYSPEKQETTINENPFYSRTNPEPSEVVDVELNGSLLSQTYRTSGDAAQSQLVELEKIADNLNCKEDTEIQKAIFNIVAEGSEILNIIAPAKICSVDQEACSKMQDNLIYLQTNPIMKRKHFEDDNECSNHFNRLEEEQQSRLLGAWQHNELEQSANPSCLWKSNPSSEVHSTPSHPIGSNPSHPSGSNPSHPSGSNPSHPSGSNPSHPSGSNPSHPSGSNPSHPSGSNPTTVETSNPSIVGGSNPTSIEHSTTVATSTRKSGNGNDDYFEKYTLVDEQVPIVLDRAELKSQEVPVQEMDNLSESNLKSTSCSEDTDIFNFDEYDMSGNPRTYDDSIEKYEISTFSVQAPMPEPCNKGKQEDINESITDVLNQKEAGSLLFSTDEGVLSRSYYPISTKLVDPALLEEPPALAFYYKDLYEEAKGRKEQNSEQSDEESSNPELSFPCQSSDTDDGNGLYFEKYVLKDDILESSRELIPEASSYLREALSQNNAVGAEKNTLFSENEDQIPAVFTDRAEIPTQEIASAKVLEVQKECEENSKTGKKIYEDSNILSEVQSVKYEEVSEEPAKAIELMGENINELVSEKIQASQVAPFEETLYVEGIQKPASNVEDHLYAGQLANIVDSFEEYGIPPREAGLENVRNTVTSVEIKDIQESASSEEMAVCQIKADILEKEQSAEQEGSECKPEVEHPHTELVQEIKSEVSGASIKADDEVREQINDNEPILKIDEIAPQTVAEGYGKAGLSATMDQKTCKVVLGVTDIVDQQLHLESTEIPGTKDEMEMLDVEMMYLQGIECMSKEEFDLENQNQEKTIGEAGSQIMNDEAISEPDNYEIILDPAKEMQEGKCLTGDVVQPLQSECEPFEVPTHETLTDIITCEQDSIHISEDFQAEYKTETEQDSHSPGTISEAIDNEMETPQQHYPQDIVQNQVADDIETHLQEKTKDLFVKTIEEEFSDLSLLEDMKIIDDNNVFERCDGLDIAGKELQEFPEEKSEDAHVQTMEGEEEADELISEKPPKPTDTFCVTCGLPIFAIDKLFGEHQDHDVIAIDTAVVKVKEKLDECVQAAEERATRTEEFVTELEDFFNAVEENCTKEETFLEEQHEEVMKLLLSQYTEMSQVLEEEKKVKLEHLYDQMVHYRCSIDSAKEAVEKTKESIQLDDMAFLKSFRMINDSVISALEAAISLELKPIWCSSFEDLAVKSARPGFESLKNLPVPQSPTIVPQEPNTATSTTITVYWTVGKDDVIDYFQVYCMDESEGNREQSGSVTDEYKMAVKESYCTMDNLEPNRCYAVWVMAVNFAGCSLPSEKVTIRTVPSAPVINPEECTVCWDSATVRWTSADLDAVDSFTLEFHRQNDFKKSAFRSVAGIRGCEQTVRLQPLENFLFFVKAVNNLGSSDISKPALISTKSTRFHLNKETVPPSLQLSEDGTVIHFDELAVENENLPTECPAVLGESLPPRGRHYWEATVDRCEAYRIGVAYPITTGSSSLGKNNKSWCMRYCATPAGHRYEFLHNSASHDVLITDFPARVGVLLDCDSGQLSFFNAQNGQLLHTIQHQFTDFICPAFVVEKPGFMTVCTGAELPEFAKRS